MPAQSVYDEEEYDDEEYDNEVPPKLGPSRYGTPVIDMSDYDGDDMSVSTRSTENQATPSTLLRLHQAGFHFTAPAVDDNLNIAPRTPPIGSPFVRRPSITVAQLGAIQPRPLPRKSDRERRPPQKYSP